MKKLLFFLLFFISIVNSFSQINAVKTTKSLDSLYQSSQFPGFAVAMVDEKGIKYINTFGYSDIKNKIRYNTTSVQNIASISKTFIGVAIMKCVDLGYFNLETNINTILPFSVINPNFKTDTIKIKHLVTHTSGIIDNEEVYSKSFYTNKYSDKESQLYKRFIKLATISGRDDKVLSVFLNNYFTENGSYYKTTNFSPRPLGTEYNYSNIASALAAYLVEIKSGMSFDLFCKKYIFEPLKMTTTSFTFTDEIAQKHVKIYNY
uniref:serine hydrolase domain-containing protein n=1 Tax=Flavobacterium sp. TaxID=239 RepID=UPI003752F272